MPEVGSLNSINNRFREHCNGSDDSWKMSSSGHELCGFHLNCIKVSALGLEMVMIFHVQDHKGVFTLPNALIRPPLLGWGQPACIMATPWLRLD